MKKKFYYPNLLSLKGMTSNNISFFEELIDHLSEINDWIEENERDKQLVLVKIILDLLIDKLSSKRHEARDIDNEFPCMPVPEWEKLNERFNKFIQEQTDLDLNDF